MFRHAQPHFENLTGTRGAYKPYSTTKHKVREDAAKRTICHGFLACCRTMSEVGGS
jgi:hypothetical protein